VGRAAEVDRRRLLGMLFGPVDVRPGGGVQDEVGMFELRGRRELDVPLVAAEGTRLWKFVRQRAAELPGGAGDQDPLSRSERIGDVVLQRWRTRGSSHAMPCSSGSAGSYSSVT